MKKLVDKLSETRELTKDEWVALISGRDEQTDRYIAQKARAECDRVYGSQVFIRGLIEISSICRNDCYYCGLRCGNKNAQRYRLSNNRVLGCCETGHELGFRTFVLQGGEDTFFNDARLEKLISDIKLKFPDCAVTLSLGERSRESYKRLFDAGADRYLLRHETASEDHYRKLHPSELSLENRVRCLYDLKEIGFQVGSGFMVGSPFQTPECLAEDMLFIKRLEPHMVGIGPFVPHHDTPFAEYPAGDVSLTVFLVAALRLMMPELLLPATTALATLDERGRERALLAGANVVMPNLSPADVRKKYLLYDNKACVGSEAAEALGDLKRRLAALGLTVPISRGDHKRI